MTTTAHLSDAAFHARNMLRSLKAARDSATEKATHRHLERLCEATQRFLRVLGGLDA